MHECFHIVCCNSVVGRGGYRFMIVGVMLNCGKWMRYEKVMCGIYVTVNMKNPSFCKITSKFAKLLIVPLFCKLTSNFAKSRVVPLIWINMQYWYGNSVRKFDTFGSWSRVRAWRHTWRESCIWNVLGALFRRSKNVCGNVIKTY